MDIQRVLKELREKAAYVQWHNQERKEHYALFAKSFLTKNVSEKNVSLFDLYDLEKIFRKSMGGNK